MNNFFANQSPPVAPAPMDHFYENQPPPVEELSMEHLYENRPMPVPPLPIKTKKLNSKRKLDLNEIPFKAHIGVLKKNFDDTLRTITTHKQSISTLGIAKVLIIYINTLASPQKPLGQ